MTTTKKKKSAREKRILIAAVITAGIMIAGSTFAWFTSTDEVTNRLSANADYGVSIVESFAPPENWLPGQEVNKDVYAVNTGNIAAFVNEDVSGVISVTYEVESDTFIESTAVKLDDVAHTAIDGATTHEGGAFLAYTTTSVPTGYLVSSRTEDGLDGAWHPTETGIYVFRRSVKTATDGTESYTYDGYYFVKGATDAENAYYKIALSDPVVDINDTEGKLSSVGYKYVLDLKETAKAVGLYYDEANTRLVATYALDPNAAYPYDAEAIAARNEVDKNNASAAKTTANTNYLSARNALDAVNDLIDARNRVVEEAQELNHAINAKNGTVTATDTSKANVDGKVDAIVVPTLSLSKDTNDYDSATQAQIITSVNKYNGLIDTVFEASNGDLAKFQAALAAVKGVPSGTVISDEQKNALTTTLSALKTHTAELSNSYAEIIDNGASYDTGGTIKTAIEGFLAQVNALSITDLNNAIAAYNAAQTTNNTTADPDATNYNQALNDYSTKLTAVTNAGVADASKYQVANTTDYTNNDADVAANAALVPYPLNKETENSFSFTNGSNTKTVAQWKAESDAADKVYNEIDARNAFTGTSKNLEIYINLDPSFASYWQIEEGVKTKVTTGTQETQEKVSFFLKKILGAGETSEKLIDSVELADSVTQDMYKTFEFDLNVHLDSAQITYDNDQRTIKSDAVTGAEWEMVVDNIDQSSKAVTWKNP